jgi:hypothetical protein
MTWKIEMGIAAFALGAAALWTANADPVLDEPASVPHERFSAADYRVFDRNFELEGQACDVGLKRQHLCFGTSPVESSLEVGATIPARLPDMPAEFPVIAKTDLKADGLQTWRFGRSLVLVRAGTREIVDVMDLAAPERQAGALFAEAETGSAAQ